MVSFSSLKASALSLASLCLFSALPAQVAATDSLGLTIHFVPHTHDDVGWLKTVDQYYYGANNSIQHAGVRYILDSVIESLKANPERKFIYVEQAFFNRWWNEQTDKIKEDVKKLVKDGQLEFINGGWCMHDEAAPHWIDMVDQTTLGHRFLKDEFDAVPRAGWQIDPFGHSATQASFLSAELGFEGLFFGRIDYQDRQQRESQKHMEFHWQSSPNLPHASVFSGAFVNGMYGPLSGFCYDEFCGDIPLQDDARLEDYNVQDRVGDFINKIKDIASKTAGSHIMLNMGSDFMYENANEWFTNLDKLIKALNADGRVKAFYSTPTNYTRSKLAEKDVEFPVKYDDFFPYADGSDSYWTGYFTSRPALKRYIRDSSSLLQVARQWEFIAGVEDNTYTENFWKAMGVAQHHDAVSGTSKQHVAYDYAKAIARGANEALEFVTGAITKYTTKTGGDHVDFQFCELRNVSICDVTQQATSGNLVVVVYNPLSRTHSSLISVPLNATSVSVSNSNLEDIDSVIFDTPVESDHVTGSAPKTVQFIAAVPAIGYSTYFITINKKDAVEEMMAEKHLARQRILPSPFEEEDKKEEAAPPAALSISNEFWKLTADAQTGLLVSAEDLENKVVYSFTQDFIYYQSYSGGGQDSGAYIFRPASDVPYKLSTDVETTVLYTSPVASALHQKVNDWISQTIRLVHGSREIEFEWVVGPVDVPDDTGREIVTRYNVTSIKSNGELYTDSNGREYQKRVRNFRPTWNWNPTQKVAGNYYPVNTGAYINDTKSVFGVLVDRSEGVASLNDGSIEFMIHRRLFHDDGRGVGEPLDETESCTSYVEGFRRIGRGLVVRGSHKVFLEPVQKGLTTLRGKEAKNYFGLRPFFGAYADTTKNYVDKHVLSASVLSTNTLPEDIAITTLQTWREKSVLVRFAHLAGKEEYGASHDLDLSKIFKTEIKSVTEMSLSANQLKEDMEAHRLSHNPKAIPSKSIPLRKTEFTIAPMEIRTFEIEFA